MILAMERTSDPGAARDRRTVARPTKRIVLSTFGSLGDLYPYLAIALGLKERGHAAIIATSATYRQTVEGLGLEFHPVRPDVPDPSQMRGKMRRFMDERRGTELVIKEWILPALRDSFDDLMKAADSADAIVSHTLTFAVPLVAELRSITWISPALQPGAFSPSTTLRWSPRLPPS